VPFGMYLQYMGKTKTLLRAAACGLLFSLCIETMQYVFGTGYSELDDLILNTIGAWIGAAVVRVGFQKSWGVAD
ncbi:MAG: VanZ family protein, partial [Lachnospiraceae bacterium]|nr:VanZ family protein [Lachnospiraceae bacterium]